jgi:hypothetical protein
MSRFDYADMDHVRKASIRKRLYEDQGLSE